MIYNKWIHLQVHDRRPPCCKLDLYALDLLLVLFRINLAVANNVVVHYCHLLTLRL